MKFDGGMTRKLVCLLVVAIILLAPALSQLSANTEIDGVLEQLFRQQENAKAQLNAARNATPPDPAKIQAAEKKLAAIGKLINQAQKQQEAAKVNDSECGLTNFGACIVDVLVQASNMLFSALGKLVNVTVGTFANLSIYYSVVTFADLANMPIITEMWRVVRDFLNITLLFALLYTAIRVILGLSDSNVQRTIIRIILVGLLINFSILIPRVIIDGSNLITLFFYNQVGVPNVVDLPQLGLDVVKPLLDNMSLQRSDQIDASAIDRFFQLIPGFIGRLVMLSVVAFALLIMGLLFIVRAGILLLLIVLSPIAVFAYAVPELSKRSSQWWEQLWAQVTFAPMFMLLYLFAVKASAAGNVLLQKSTGNLTIQTIFSVTFTLIFLFAALNVALKSGGVGHRWAVDTSVKLKDRFKRQTSGRLASRFARSDLAKKWQANSPLVGGALRRGTQTLARDYDKVIDDKAKERASVLRELKGTKPGKKGWLWDRKDITDKELQRQYVRGAGGAMSALFEGGQARQKTFEALTAKEQAGMYRDGSDKDKAYVEARVRKMSDDQKNEFHKEYLSKEDAKGGRMAYIAGLSEGEQKEAFKTMADWQKAQMLHEATTAEERETYSKLRGKLDVEEKDKLSQAEAKLARALTESADEQVNFMEKLAKIDPEALSGTYGQMSADERIKYEREARRLGMDSHISKLRASLTEEQKNKTTDARVKAIIRTAQQAAVASVDSVLKDSSSSLTDIAGALKSINEWKNKPAMIAGLSPEAIDQLAAKTTALPSITIEHLKALTKAGRAREKLKTALLSHPTVSRPVKDWVQERESLFFDDY